ncbi:phage late control D family protein [Janthinobacterium sp. B9-8]|uniref:phage late control D family protein n=1 Tax=Janthinobacterium sp. B9-8 TaxID=1236179 RepID=UPI00061CFA01|nr:phage late control D family protein [Janthinobacterium sp. B9-8]AMC35393.1 late control protein D [Janthinobacterium sp. B9-8]
MNEGHKSPRFKILVGSKDISKLVNDRLVSVGLTDNRGFEADQLDITLDDSDGLLEIPPRGAVVSVSLGWSDSGLVDKGQYTVDEVEHSGAPDQLTIRARSADLRAGLSVKKERSWHQTTVGAIVETIAKQNKIQHRIGQGLAGQAINHIDQTSESDASFLSRIAKMFDAIATVKDNSLLFMKAGQATTASGKPLGKVLITRQSGDSHRFGIADRGAYSGVKAAWQNTKTAKKETTTVKRKPRKKAGPGQGEVIQGADDNVKTLRHVYASKTNAERAAKAEWEKLQRGVAQFSISLAYGRPELFPELPASVSGFKPIIDKQDWIISRATHSLTDSGYTTALELEVKASEVDG